MGGTAYGGKDGLGKIIRKEVPVPGVEKKEGKLKQQAGFEALMYRIAAGKFTRRAAVGGGVFVVEELITKGYITKLAASGLSYLFSEGTPSESPISLAGGDNQTVESYIEETMFHNYKNVGPTKSLDGKVRVGGLKAPPSSERILDEGMIYDGETPYITLAVSPDGKKGYVYANKAAFEGDGAINLDFDGVVSGDKIAQNLFTEVVSQKVFAYEIDFAALRNKYPSLKGIVVDSADIRTTNEWQHPHAVSKFVFD